jgi:agmatine/peptidylarginine deiminase
MFDVAWRRSTRAKSHDVRPPAVAKPTSWRRLPGEFERQQAVLLAAHGLAQNLPQLFAEVVCNLGGSIDVVVLVNDSEDMAAAVQALRDYKVDASQIRYLVVPHDTMWVRDYGPMVVVGPRGHPMMIDADYDADDRPADEQVPAAVAHQWQRPVLQAGLVIEGGNLLSNGQGLLIATNKLVETNSGRGWTAATVQRQLAAIYGCRQLVLLEAPLGEPSGHVDMFATFISPKTVVIGKVDPEVDFENAMILDRNAEALSWVVTQNGPLNVVRVPMPPREADLFPTYTNVIYANGVLLVPVYPGLDAAGARKALDIFATLLPGWRVVPIDACGLAEMYGGLHCMSMNLGPVGELAQSVEPPGAAAPLRLPADNLPDQMWSLRRYDSEREDVLRPQYHTAR